MSARVVKKFMEIDPTFIHAKVIEAHKSNLMHLERGCLSDHPEVNLYIRKTDGKEFKFQELKSSRGSSQLENWHLRSAQAIAATTASPILYDLLLQEYVARWNVKCGVASGTVPDCKSFNLALLNSLFCLWNSNKTLFVENPVPGF